MLRFLKLTILFFAIALGLLATVAWTPNGAFEFCTTRAWGLPFPWRVDYCPCEGGNSVTPIPCVVLNLGLAASAGLAGAGLLFWIRPGDSS